MTNFDKWRLRTDGLPTPDNMIDWSWLSLIASCLQRRVFLGPPHKPLFANNYYVFVSPPGVGKSLVIDEVQHFVRHWKHGDNAKLLDEKFTAPEHKVAVECVQDTDRKNGDTKPKNEDEPTEMETKLLIPLASDASTYEALILAFGKCFRRINYTVYSEQLQKDIIQVYGHSSLSFQLKEIGSLLRKRTNDTVIFMLGMYDCPLDYEYDTVSRKKDKIRKGFLHMLAATNPEFMNEMFNDKLIDNAFLSRCIFVYAHKDRKDVSKIPPLSTGQVMAENDIKAHLLKLSTLYGLVKEGEGVDEWIHKWFVHHKQHPELRSSRNVKLDHYYSRKLVHMKKVAMALHFGESTEMTIPLETFQRAVLMLDKEEKFMHLALTLDAKDKTSMMVKRIQEMLKGGQDLTMVEISCNIFQSLGMVDKKSLDEAMTFLAETGEIRSYSKKDETTETEVMYWRMR